MSIFNRKQKTEEGPSETETQILKQLDEQKEFNQLLMKEIKRLKQDHLDLLNHLNKEFEIIATDITKVKTGLIDEISKESDAITRRVKIESTKISDLVKTMDTVTLDDSEIRKATRIGYEYLVKEHGLKARVDNTYKIPEPWPITAVVDDDPKLSEDNSHEEKPKQMNPLTIEDVLNTLEEPSLKAEPTPRKAPVKENRKHLLQIAESLHQPYHLKLTPNGHFINKNNNNTKQTKFTIHDVIRLKENIPHYHKKGYNYKTITSKYPHLSDSVVKRLIWNIEEGNFDELIKEYNTGQTNKYGDLSFNINDRYKKPYNLKKLDGINIHRKGQGSSKLGFTILDVLYIKENLPRWIHEQSSRGQVAKETGMAPDRLQRVIYNVMEGTFDEYLKDFEDLGGQHKFTIVNNNLYIDTKDTGIDLSTCRMILHDYTNAANKYMCLKNLIRTYNDIKPQHLVTVTRYYDDVDFRDMILHDENLSVTVVNNPEKRRDYGTSVII